MDTREILERLIKDHQAGVDKTTKELAELDRPRLKHGDYGYGIRAKEIFVAIEDNCSCDSEPRPIYKDGDSDGSIWAKNHPENYIIYGNIFDDLERNSKDLEEFKVIADGCNTTGFSAELEGSGVLLGNIEDGWWYKLNKAVEIHQKLGRLIATARKKERKQ